MWRHGAELTSPPGLVESVANTGFCEQSSRKLLKIPTTTFKTSETWPDTTSPTHPAARVHF